MARLTIISLGLIAASYGIVNAEPTTLNLIPTTDTLRAGIGIIGYYNAIVWPADGSVTVNLLETEYGIGGRFEFGADLTLSGDRETLLNFKYRIFDESGHTPAVAVGIQNAGTNLSSQPYVATCKTFPAARLHFGIIDTYGTARAMFGAEKFYGKLFVLQTDYISGSGNWFTLGFVAGGMTGWSVNFAGLVGNSDTSGNGYLLNVQWGATL
ncbi:MAG: hypothetical protein ABFD49_12080 [Armatimonadota bacterium]|nr:YjbH domain-containing protein [bacterium]